MSQVLINRYLTDLAKLRQVGGTHRESVVREAFKDLLKSWGRALDLTYTLSNRQFSKCDIERCIAPRLSEV